MEGRGEHVTIQFGDVIYCADCEMISRPWLVNSEVMISCLIHQRKCDRSVARNVGGVMHGDGNLSVLASFGTPFDNFSYVDILSKRSSSIFTKECIQVKVRIQHGTVR